jgi:hypothetical protein
LEGFCDKWVRNGALVEPDSDCGMACGGNASETCGGPNRLTVWSNTTVTVLPVPGPQKSALPGSWQYVGCLTDDAQGSRTFPNQVILPNNNTATTCLDQCAMYGYWAGGLEYGDECCKYIKIP